MYSLMKPVLKIISISLVLQAFAWTGQVCQAQGQWERPMNIPTKYIKPTASTQNETGLSESFRGDYWKVWIDREKLVTSTGMQTELLDEFWVVEESESRVHIVKDNGSFDGYEFDDEILPVDFGWVPKKRVILWNTSLYDEKTKFREKVLTISDINHMEKNKDQIIKGEKLMEFFGSPATKVPLDKETTLFEVFYVYKTEGERVLIGKDESLDKRVAKNVIYGWVDMDIIQLWGHRQTLEPASGIQQVQMRKSKGVKTSVFASPDETRKYIQNPVNNTRSFWNDDHYEAGYDPYWKRFPILSNENGIVETAVISDLITVSENEEGEVEVDTVDAKEYERLNKLYNEQKERTSQINVVFVVDGTRSMEEPIESVKKAVIQTATRLYESVNKFQFGAVIYRDYNNAKDDKCFELSPLGDYLQFNRFMNRVSTDDPACFNSTVSEGMYKGLMKADGLFRGKERETNVIVLVGDAGDRQAPWRIGEDEVVKMLVKNRASLITIQAHRWKNQAYEDFFYQARDLSLLSAKKLSGIQKQMYGSTNLTALTTTPRFAQSKSGNRTLFNLENSPVDGGLQIAGKDEVIPPDIIESEVKRILLEIDSTNQDLLASLDLMIQSYGETGFTPEAIQILINAGFPAEYIELLSKRRYQFLIRGFTAPRVDLVESPLYDFVLFVDGAEFDDLVKSLNKLVIPGQNVSARREGLYNAFIQLLTTNYGARIEEIANLSLAEIMALITGLPSTSELFKRYTLSDIQDPIKMNNAEVDEVINGIKQSRKRLLQVRADDTYFFRSNLRQYYWLPQQILP